MNDLKDRLKELDWQFELLLSLDSTLVAVGLDGCEFVTGSLSDKAAMAKTILEVYANRGSEALGNALEEISSQDFPQNVVTAVLFWQWRELTDALFTRKPDLPKPTARGDFVKLFDPLSLYEYGQSCTNQNSSRDEQTKRVFKQLISTGPYRRFIFEDNTLQRLEQLKSLAPNFEPVVDYLMDAVGLAVYYNKPIKITPMLLVGDPGVGKSYFSHQLATALGVPSRRIAMDNFQTGSALAGSSYVWSNSETGVVFKALSEGSHISPLIILDEIDKANNTFAHYGDSLSPLHNLLEPESAKAFEDASFSLKMDASHIIWIATGNSIEKIPDPLKSRFEIFEIRLQTADQLSSVLEEICAGLVSEYPGIEFEKALFEELSATTPREQRQVLQRAVARAIRLGDSKVTLAHLRLITDEGRNKADARSFGFRSGTGMKAMKSQ